MREPVLINPVEDENWNNRLLNTAGYSFFHTANWADVLSRSYSYQPLYLCEINDDTCEAMIPIMEVVSLITGKRGVCLPFTDSCQPIADQTHKFRELFNQAIALGRMRNWKYLEIRGGEKNLPAEKPSQSFIGHTLDLNCGPQKLFANLRGSTRRNIIKAQNEKVTVNISRSLPDVKEFYRLNAMTRKAHGLPPQPWSFFKNLYDCVLTNDMGFVATASFRDQVIAANFYFQFKEEVIYKYGASDKAWQHLRANNLLMWEAVKWSCHHGFQSLSFGRTEQNHKGLMQFKAGWGAQQYQINYYRYDLQKNAFTSNPSDINPVFKKIFFKLPLPVLKMLGRVLYRHMG